MDPDALIQEILDLQEELTDDSRVPALTIDQRAEKGTDLAAKIRDLDEWLMRGGYPPARWNRGGMAGA